MHRPVSALNKFRPSAVCAASRAQIGGREAGAYTAPAGTYFSILNWEKREIKREKDACGTTLKRKADDRFRLQKAGKKAETRQTMYNKKRRKIKYRFHFGGAHAFLGP